MKKPFNLEDAVLDAMSYVNPVKNIRELLDSHPEVCLLKFMAVKNNNFNVMVLAEVLKANRSLEEINFEHIEIGIQGAQALAEAITVNKNLRKLSFKYNNFGNEGAEALANGLRDNETLQVLDLRNNNIGKEGAKALAEILFRRKGQHLKVNQTLRKLDLDENNIGNEGADFFAEALHHNKSLRELNLGHNKIEDVGIKTLAEALKVNSSLEMLSLQTNAFSNEGFQYLAEALMENCGLLVLNLNFNNIRLLGVKASAEINNSMDWGKFSSYNHDQHQEYFAKIKTKKNQAARVIGEALKANKSLRELSLWSAELGPEGAQALAEALIINQSLCVLNLQNNQIGKQGTSVIAKALKVNQSLQELNLDSNHIGKDDAQALAEALKVNQSLENLYLNDNEIREEGAQALAEVLILKQNLRKLGLGGAQIGNEGARVLARALEVNSSLEELNLASNEIGDQGAQALAEALKVNDSLKVLTLSENKMGDIGAQNLADSLGVNHGLITLSLGIINIEKTGGLLGKALKVNQSLRTLYLECNNIGNKTNDALAEGFKYNRSIVTYAGPLAYDIQPFFDRNQPELEKKNFGLFVLGLFVAITEATQKGYCPSFIIVQKILENYKGYPKPKNIKKFTENMYGLFNKRREQTSIRQKIITEMPERFEKLMADLKTKTDARQAVQELTKDFDLKSIMELCPILIITRVKELTQNPLCSKDLIGELLRTFELEELFSKEPLQVKASSGLARFTRSSSELFTRPEYFLKHAANYLHLLDPSDPFCAELKERVRTNSCTDEDQRFMDFISELYTAFRSSRELLPACYRNLPKESQQRLYGLQ